jgi:predicted DCC family thiol-disulfide oxidoreductase YuxK
VSDGKSVILFDGVCNLCNASINFILERDKTDRFLVGAIQEGPGQRLLRQFKVPPAYLDSVILIEQQRIYFRSSAALRISRHLSGPWPMLYPLIVLPRFIRDGLYDWIGKNRYRWFGKNNTCRVPTPEERAKFLS